MAAAQDYRHDYVTSGETASETTIQKRDGSLAPFDAGKISRAILNAGKQAEFAARSTFSIAGKGSPSSLNPHSISREGPSAVPSPHAMPTKETAH